MPRLLSAVLHMRKDPRMLKVPPYLSALCVVVGVVWLFLLPLNDYSRRTYISENALLPGQVHTYFGGSDQNVFRAYRHELDELQDKTNIEINDGIENIYKGIGLKVGRQNYTYRSAGKDYSGQNVYAILQAPRGDATEAIVLVTAWKNIKNEWNRSAVALGLTLARYFKRWSLWSKDIIIVTPPDSRAGIQAWVDAYHDAHNAANVASLPIKSGALQGALALDFPQEARYESLQIVYDGVNGQLPNLDLFNSMVLIAAGQMGMQQTFIHDMQKHSDSYDARLATMLRGMLNQGLGQSTGPHSSFIPYHVDALTIQPVGQGWHDEMGLGRIVEGTFRSLNNLLEKLHQSFFFYILMNRDRFVSIGTYLPSAMLVAANFSIMATNLWIKSGQEDTQTGTANRELLLPLITVAICQFLGGAPLAIFSHIPSEALVPVFLAFAALSAASPFILSYGIQTFIARKQVSLQQYELIKCFSLLLLGMFLSALATLNFSLALIVGLLATPLSFARTWPDNLVAARILYTIFLQVVSPPVILLVASAVLGPKLGGSAMGGLHIVLEEAMFGWNVLGMYTPLVLWAVWWPAWIVGCLITLGRPVNEAGKPKQA
ncbi:Gaa1-like protein [Microdochium trichocladiopsis]|uniref:Gaa1-like protein n=1 Tax=Microdochium trichocladiopsis TaxID=1682393 RepID=A0A9P8Y2P6_9PEZI|nr:Gaa1-like protein [Microdochium trichocladiopsis]KAH7029339.1 Gaa1-like protein [Microdochium trichocladiopsis]